jgi:hypothetical protein
VLTAFVLAPSDGDRSSSNGAQQTYDEVVLSDRPVGYWRLSSATRHEADLTGNGHVGTYEGGTPGLAPMPNGDEAALFDGVGEYLVVPSSAAFSIPTTGSITWEAWIRPTVLEFPRAPKGYVDWMGKCAERGRTCEWAARMYAESAPKRCSRLSAYAFNPSGGRGSGAAWQPVCGLFEAGRWYHVVAEYTMLSQPADCPQRTRYPGSISIWVDAIPWNQAAHHPTGCMSQYEVAPAAGDSPLTIATMAGDSWFPGAVGKVAVYDHLLGEEQIVRHYAAMTGRRPTGRCGDVCSF